VRARQLDRGREDLVLGHGRVDDPELRGLLPAEALPADHRVRRRLLGQPRLDQRGHAGREGDVDVGLR
jgi:hypothetical protein